MKLTGIVFLSLLKECVFVAPFCLEIKNCEGGKVPRPWSKKRTNQLTATYIQPPKCDPPGPITIHWLIDPTDATRQTMDNTGIQQQQNVLTVKPFALSKGKFMIRAISYVKDTKDFIPSAQSKECEADVLPENPVPVLVGGSERAILAGKSFTMDGRKSKNMDSAKRDIKRLEFKWKCAVVEGKDKTFCAKETIGTKSTLVVPQRYVLPDHTYKFTLSVKNADSDWISTSQVVKILTSVVTVNIECRKNCSPLVEYTDASGITYFEVTCVLSKCEELGVKSYKWTLAGQTLNYDKDTKFGRADARFVIKENVLKPGKKYKLSVLVKDSHGRTGFAARDFETKMPPKLKSCKTSPSSGTAFKTSFGVDCQLEGNVIKFEIYTATKGSDTKVLLTSAVRLKELKFILPADNDVFIKGIDDHGFTDEHKLDVNVTPGPQDVQSLKDAVAHLEDTKNYEQTAQIITGMLYKEKKEPQQNEETKKWIMDKLDEFPLDTEDQVKQVSALMAIMADGDEKKPNPDVAEKVSKICKKLAEKHLQHAIDNPTEAKTSEAQQVTKDLMSCVETNTQQNDELLKPPDTIHVETPFPLLPEEEVITENYPEYVDDEKIVRNTDKLDVATQNFLDICILNAKSISATSVTGEGTVGSSTKFCEVSVSKDTGNKMGKTALEAKGVTVTPSSDFKNISEDVTSTMCVWSKNPFWWMSRSVNISTNVILIKYSDKNKTYTTFEDPVIVSLAITEKTAAPEIHDIEFPTPGTYASEDDLSIVRVEVKRNEAFSVRFYLEDFQKFRMVSSDFRKPTFEEVQNKGTLIDKASASFYQRHDHDYDGWHYISMLPENEETGSAKSNSTHLECECLHLSVLAGVTYDNAIRVEKAIKFQYVMILLTNYGILVATSVIFLIYCILILFTRKKPDTIYVLADVSRFSRYLYLIVVQTGAKLKSGTTSNVCIKVYGANGESKEHVLNYPDPQNKILQRGQRNLFVMTNEYHLGDLSKIDLWFDCIGRQPSWFCQSVTIYDVQTKENWYFEVNRWLSLHPHNEAYVTTEPANTENVEEEKKEIEKEKLKMKKCQACLQKSKKLTSTLCKKTSESDDMSLFARYSILLSVFVTTYGVVMIMYGMPIMKLRDGFTTYGLRFHWAIIVIPICSALITFAVHVALIWLWDLPKFQNKLPFWSLLTFNVTLWMSLLVIFGFWVPLPKMWLWLIASGLALLIYYLVFSSVYNNIRRVGQKVKTTAISIFTRTKDLVQIVETQRRFLFKEFGEAVLRPYLSHLYQPLNEQEMKQKKLREEAKMKVIELLSDVVMFLVYISLLYLVILANKDRLTIISYQKMLQLLSGEFTRSLHFNKVTNIEDTYTYLNVTLIPATQSVQWYGKFVVDDPGTMVDYHNRYMGVVRLRQHRVKEKKCKIPRYMEQQQFSYRCFPEFSTSHNEEKPFGAGTSPRERMASVWNYTKWNKAGTLLTIGTISRYPGGGYIAPLGRTMKNSMVNLHYLNRKNWMNPVTRTVLVEFIAYNANVNLFNAIRILFEYSATGYVEATYDINTARLVFVENETQIVKAVIFLTFVFTLVVFSVKLSYKLWYKRKFFFRDLWLLIDLMIVLLSCGCFVLFCYRITLVGRFLEAVENAKKNEFINYFTLFRWEAVLTCVAAFLVCVATIRLWKLLRFGTVFLVVEKTILLSAIPIVAMLFCQAVIFVAFALTAYIAFGSSSSVFKDYSSAVVTLFILSLGLDRLDIDDFARTYQSFGVIFYCVFMFSTLYIYTIYIVIICMNYNTATTEYSNFNNPVKMHVISELRYFKNWLTLTINRLRAGNEHQEPRHVTPKADEHRYADCTSIPKNKLELMTFIVRNLLEGQALPNDNKIRLMLSSASKHLQEASDVKEIFFKGQDARKKFKLVHDDKIVEIMKVVEGLLGKTYRQNAFHRTMNRQMKKLNNIEEVLKIISKVFDNIKLTEDNN